MKPTIGFIGLGLMGIPMTARLISSGYAVHVHNRTKEKAGVLLERGAQWMNSPAETAANTDIIFTMVTNDSALREITTGIQSALRQDGIHIDCSTVSPSLTSSLEAEYLNSGRMFLHSPVLGGVPQAAEGSLLLFVGGDDRAFTLAEPVLKILGTKIWRFPKAEQASNMKLVMNSFIAGMISTLSQAMVFAERTGIGGETLLDVLGHSALNSTMYQTKGRLMLDRNFAARFFIENLLKDTNLFRDAASTLQIPTPVSDTVKKILEEGVAMGLGKEDYSAVIKTFERK